MAPRPWPRATRSPGPRTGARADLDSGDVSSLYPRADDAWICTVDTGSDTATSSTVTVDACGGALQFVVGHALSAPTSGTVSLNDPWTLELWINLEDADEESILTSGRNSYYGLELESDSGFQVTYKYDIYNVDWTSWDTGVQIHGDGWQHIAIVFGSGFFRMYQNGVYVAGESSPNGLHISTTEGLELAMDNAVLDELHVSLQAKFSGNFTPAYPLASDADTELLHLDEGSGSSILDSGPHANHGTTTAYRCTSSRGCP